MDNSVIRSAGSNDKYAELKVEAKRVTGGWFAPGFDHEYAMRRIQEAYSEVGLWDAFKSGMTSSKRARATDAFDKAEIRAMNLYGDGTPAFWAWYEGWMLVSGSF